MFKLSETGVFIKYKSSGNPFKMSIKLQENSEPKYFESTLWITEMEVSCGSLTINVANADDNYLYYPATAKGV